MKKLTYLTLASILGGLITLGAYKLFIEKETIEVASQQSALPTYVPTAFTNAEGETVSVDFTAAAENAVHAVVHVKNKATSNQPTSILDLFYGRGSERVRVGTGSGVIISPDGYIVTNNHVIDGANEIEITLNNNKSYNAELVGKDVNNDVALLKIEVGEELPFIVFGDSDATRLGEWVLAVGNPFNLTSTVTAGIISAKARDLNELDDRNQYFLQTDAAVNPGNSGGALVNTRGELVGINTAITSQTGSYVGYSFAVPSNTVKKIIEDLLEYGTVQKGLLGISTLNRNSSYAVENGLSEIEGVYITDVDPNSGAKKAGIQPGDIIKRLDGVKIRKFSDLSGYLSSKRPNDLIKVTVNRDKRTKVFEVQLSDGKAFVELGTVKFLDMELRNLPDSSKERLEKITGQKEGVLVVKNTDAGLYNYGLTPGAVIVEVNDKPVSNISYLRKFDTAELKNIVFINTEGSRERLIFSD